MQAYATPETGLSPRLRLVNSSAPMSASPSIGQGYDVLDLLLMQLAELVADRVAAQLTARQPEHDDEWLDTRRAAEYLGISRDSVRRLAAEGSIPTEQAGVGCKLYFRRSALDAWRCCCPGPIEPLRGRRHG
jgi:excisionase family DNA binding protein